jgi:2-keto-4-pentenoate hydratase/2-oxohepta-3-ene-1,7-dioic acid hydratase in catechol pathway
VVIGRAGRDIPTASAIDHVLGYSCLNDVSARDVQFADQQWTRGKSFDGFCPMGPVLVTSDEVGDPLRLEITCRVNGEERQRASLGEMLFSIAEIVSFASLSCTLQAGDVIATGTPSGVGAFMKPPRCLQNGDTVSIEISHIGTLTNTFGVRGRNPESEAANP